MPDDPKTPEQIAAEKAEADAAIAAAAETKRKADALELAQAVSKGVVDGLAEREAKKPAAVVDEPPIKVIDPNEIDRRIKAGEPIADLIAEFGAGVEERTRRAVAAETGSATAGLQDLILNQARQQIEHFKEYEAEILTIVGRVRPANRTFKTYADASAMVLGRPDVAKKLNEAAIADAIAKVTAPKKVSAGAAETGIASRVVRTTGAELSEGNLKATEENMRELFGDDEYRSFMELKKSRGVTIDSFARSLGYADGQAWFDRAQENDRRSMSGEGLGGDVNWVRDAAGGWVKQGPAVTGISR